MKMREEIDALQVMGLPAMNVLIVPRLLALVISLPMLAFIADVSGLFGGVLTSWFYGGISPAAFGHRCRRWSTSTPSSSVSSRRPSWR